MKGLMPNGLTDGPRTNTDNGAAIDDSLDIPESLRRAS